MAAVVFQGSPASVDVSRQGIVVFPAGAGGGAAITVADTAITANSLVVCCGAGVADATAFLFAVSQCQAGVGFSIKPNAQATADKTVNWAVLKY
jgi:hypothetical protein